MPQFIRVSETRVVNADLIHSVEVKGDPAAPTLYVEMPHGREVFEGAEARALLDALGAHDEKKADRQKPHATPHGQHVTK